MSGSPPTKFEQVEHRFGMPMAEVLSLMYERYERQALIARALDITQGTLSQWLIRCGLKQKTILVKFEEVTDTAPIITKEPCLEKGV
mgnify:CR=1 FL=1